MLIHLSQLLFITKVCLPTKKDDGNAHACMLSRLFGWSCWLFSYWSSDLDLTLNTANFNLSRFVSQLC